LAPQFGFVTGGEHLYQFGAVTRIQVNLVRDPDPGEAPHPIFGWPLSGRLLVPTPVPPNPKFKEAGKRNCSTP